MGKLKPKACNLTVQKLNILSYFPNSSIKVNKNVLKWVGILKPTALSDSYKIRLEYKFNKHPNVYVISKKLIIHSDSTSLPHVYSTEKQWLCLYYRLGKEWNGTMLLANTIIPWTSEWLLHYEYWLITGKWFGGGVHIQNKPFVKDVNPLPDKL